jgi:predicted peptidase
MDRRHFLKLGGLAGLSLPFNSIGNILAPSADVWTAQTIPGSYAKTYGCASGGFQIAFMEVMHQFVKTERASTKKTKRKFPLFIFLHGIGERSANTTSARGNPATLSDLFTTNLMSVLKTDTSANYTYIYKNPDGSREYPIFWAPQCWGGHAYFYPSYLEAMLDWAEDEYSDIIDFNRIYLTGLSFGGGGCIVGLQYHPVSRRVCAAAFNVPGYTTYGLGGSCQFPDNNNYAEIVANKIPVWTNHAQNDDETDDNNTGDFSYHSNNFVSKLLAAGHKAPVIYSAFGTVATSPHRIWNYMYGTSNWGTIYTLRNGTTFKFGGTLALNFVDWCLQYNRLPRAA